MSVQIEGEVKNWKTVVAIAAAVAFQYGCVAVVVVAMVQCTCKGCLW